MDSSAVDRQLPQEKITMRRITLVTALLVTLLSGCGIFKKEEGKNGELTGAIDRPQWDNPVPFGMLYIPAGTYHMGQNEQDVNVSQIARNRQVTISAFYMDETEITNNEYRQFVNYMTSSASGSANTSSTVVNYNSTPLDSVIRFMVRQHHVHINKIKVKNGKRGYFYVDFNKDRPAVSDTNFVQEDLYYMCYPDTLVWERDFSYSYNEPLVENYWIHPAFDNYPVVGVNWYAAQAFSIWRTIIYNENRYSREMPIIPRIRLPTEAEWEYAARGGYEHKQYPWAGPYVRNSKGCLYANFKPGRGDYIADNYEYTAPVDRYWPNDYGLYQMSGNVAEWVEDDFEESGYSYAHDLNPLFKNPTDTRKIKVIRGGSWKDISYYLSVGTRTFEYAVNTRSYIGFRCAMSEIGRSGAATP